MRLNVAGYFPSSPARWAWSENTSESIKESREIISRSAPSKRNEEEKAAQICVVSTVTEHREHFIYGLRNEGEGLMRNWWELLDSEQICKCAQTLTQMLLKKVCD